MTPIMHLINFYFFLLFCSPRTIASNHSLRDQRRTTMPLPLPPPSPLPSPPFPLPSTKPRNNVLCMPLLSNFYFISFISFYKTLIMFIGVPNQYGQTTTTISPPSTPASKWIPPKPSLLISSLTSLPPALPPPPPPPHPPPRCTPPFSIRSRASLRRRLLSAVRGSSRTKTSCQISRTTMHCCLMTRKRMKRRIAKRRGHLISRRR